VKEIAQRIVLSLALAVALALWPLSVVAWMTWREP
jgi:hypothetical protein